MLIQYCKGNASFSTQFSTMRFKILCSTKIQNFEQLQRQSCQELPGAYLSCLFDRKILQGITFMLTAKPTSSHFRSVVKNPLHYEALGLNKISINLNGNISSLGMIDVANGQATGAYHALVKACSVSNSGFSFDLEDFEG